MIKRAIFYGTSQDKFNKHFTSDDDCFKYLSEIKWKDDTFVCTRCGNTHYCKGHLPFSRRCTKCKHDESPTAGTVFDKLKFSLNTAFHIAFNLCTSENGVTSTALSIKYGLRQKTAWDFKRKIQHAMGYVEDKPLEGMILVDTFEIGDSKCSPKGDLVIIGMEILSGKIAGHEYAYVVDSASPDSIRDFFKKHISRNSQIIVGKESRCEQYADEYSDRTATRLEYSALMDNHVSNLKKWLFGVHRHCSAEYIQDYLNEYYFRLNGHKDNTVLFDTLMNLIVKNKPLH